MPNKQRVKAIPVIHELNKGNDAFIESLKKKLDIAIQAQVRLNKLCKQYPMDC